MPCLFSFRDAQSPNDPWITPPECRKPRGQVCVEHETLDDSRLISAQTLCEPCDRLGGISTVNPQAFVRDAPLPQDVDQSTGAIQAEDNRPPDRGIEASGECHKRTLGTADIQVGNHKRDGDRLIGPCTK